MAHAGSFKSHENAFLNDPKCQKQGFLDLGLIDWLDIVYYGRTICFTILGNTTRSWQIIQKSRKCIFEWSKGPKSGFLNLGLMDQHDIAYYDESKCFPTLGNTARSWRIIPKSRKSILVKWGWLDWSDISYYSGSLNVHRLSQVQKSSACSFLRPHWPFKDTCLTNLVPPEKHPLSYVMFLSSRSPFWTNLILYYDQV